MPITHKAELPINYNTTVQDIFDFVDPLPMTARVDVLVQPYYNQFDSGSKTLTATWTDT